MSQLTEVEDVRQVYEQLKQLCSSEITLVRDAAVMMLAVAHDVLRNIDVADPPPHPADYE